MSGLMSVTGERPDGPPVKVGLPVCDIVAGILLALGVVSAYTHRLKTGEGQMVDTSLFEAGVTLTYWQSAIAFATGIAPRALGLAHLERAVSGGAPRRHQSGCRQRPFLRARD